MKLRNCIGYVAAVQNGCLILSTREHALEFCAEIRDEWMDLHWNVYGVGFLETEA